LLFFGENFDILRNFHNFLLHFPGKSRPRSAKYEKIWVSKCEKRFRHAQKCLGIDFYSILRCFSHFLQKFVQKITKNQQKSSISQRIFAVSSTFSGKSEFLKKRFNIFPKNKKQCNLLPLSYRLNTFTASE